MLYFLLKLMCIKILHYYIWIDNVYFTIRIQLFELLFELLRGFYMACVCFVYLCDVRHLDKRIYKQCSGIYQEWQGRQEQGYPLPLPGQSDGQATPEQIFLFFRANFFIFFLPYPHKSSNLPIFFPSERFSLPLCVFPYPCIFSCL